MMGRQKRHRFWGCLPGHGSDVGEKAATGLYCLTKGAVSVGFLSLMRTKVRLSGSDTEFEHSDQDNNPG